MFGRTRLPPKKEPDSIPEAETEAEKLRRNGATRRSPNVFRAVDE
jgi:hypothetical protein